MVKSTGVKCHQNHSIIFIITALTGALVFVISIIASFSRSPSSSVTAAGVQSINISRILHSLSATFVRIDAADPASPGSSPRLVLSIEAADLTAFMDAYRRGFATEGSQYPDDGGILLHNPELCRGRRLDWVVYVHTSPGHQRRRQLLRDTWANYDLFKHLSFRVVFLLGKYPPELSNLQARVAHLARLSIKLINLNQLTKFMKKS